MNITIDDLNLRSEIIVVKYGKTVFDENSDTLKIIPSRRNRKVSYALSCDPLYENEFHLLEAENIVVDIKGVDVKHQKGFTAIREVSFVESYATLNAIL